MITRIYIWILLGTILPYLWCFCHELRHRPLVWRLLHWIPALIVIGYSSYLAMLPNFVPDHSFLVDIWFVIMAFFAVPVFVYAFFSFGGWCIMKSVNGRHNWGKLMGLVLGFLSIGVFLYGFTYGFRRLEVKHVTVVLPQLPSQFDGYRIVLFSDFHLGSYYGWRSDLPQRDVDSINAQHPDMICFTGDLQNTKPSEVRPYVRMLSSLRAKDGVYSVLGNHDYSFYVDADSLTCVKQEAEMRSLQWQMGWHLLCNQHAVVHRGADSIFVAGTENFKKPAHADVAKALQGIRPGNFVLMLQHIPTQWENMMPSRINEVYGAKGKPLVAPQLTFSGHTHAGQVSVFGLRPTMFAPYDYGLYEREGCQLFTTAGLGGVVPVRVNSTAEIVVVTLRCK